jgi:hypothetical protein
MAEQVFEGGRMLWIEEENLIYTLFGDGQLPPENSINYSLTSDTWTEDEPESDPSLTPPPGFYQPIRGFGKVWRENARIREALGWAVAPEQGYNGFYQDSQRRDTWMGNTYYYYQSLDGHIFALQRYRRGWHWGFVQ